MRIAGLRILEARPNLASPSLLGPRRRWERQNSSRQVRPGRPRQQRGSSYGAGFSLGWELDFWGKSSSAEVGRRITSYFATLAQYDDIQVLMAAQVAQLYVSIRTLEARLQIARENARIPAAQPGDHRATVPGGNSAELDVQQTRTQYLGTLSGIPQLETSLRQNQNALSTLLASAPGPPAQMASNTGKIPRASWPWSPRCRRICCAVVPTCGWRSVSWPPSRPSSGWPSELCPSITLLGTLGSQCQRQGEWHLLLGRRSFAELEPAGSGGGSAARSWCRTPASSSFWAIATACSRRPARWMTRPWPTPTARRKSPC